jgi:hypothetical protein
VGLVCALALLALLALLLGGGPRGRACPRLLVPSYFAPGDGQWQQAVAQLPAGAQLILNPASGPGAARDEVQAAKVAQARRRGLVVLGYVATGYGARDPLAVQADVERYRAWYGLQGFFIDEAPSGRERLGYYERLRSYIRGRARGPVVLNPGTPPDPGYLNVSDELVTFEGPLSSYLRSAPPAWQRRQSPARLVELVYAAPDGADLTQLARVARDRHVGSIYVTSGALPNPWITLPRYLRAEVRAAAALCAG